MATFRSKLLDFAQLGFAYKLLKIGIKGPLAREPWSSFKGPGAPWLPVRDPGVPWLSVRSPVPPWSLIRGPRALSL